MPNEAQTKRSTTEASWTVRIGEVRLDWTGTREQAERLAAEWNQLEPGHYAQQMPEGSR